MSLKSDLPKIAETDRNCLVPEGIGLLLEEAKDQPKDL